MKPHHSNWSLADWLAYQEQLHPKAIDLGLVRVARVADALGLRRAPPLTITVGGTNGKGSSTTLLGGIYRHAGHRTGVYTSPHLYRYHERIAIDGEPVDDRALCSAFSAIEAARGGTPLTYFEFGTLAALWLFRESKVDVQVLEVGLGGRLDAVNVLDADAALVTNIGLDHQDWLGEGRDAIGREKAGIYRAGRVAVCADPSPPQGLLQAAAAAGVTLIRRDAGGYQHEVGQGSWRWQGLGTHWRDLPLPALTGTHQLDNAAGVLAVVAGLQPRLPVPDAAIHKALRMLRLAGRMEWRGRFLLDVAHNAEACTALANALAAHPSRAMLLVGALADKPIEGMAAALRERVDQAFCIRLPPPRGLPAEALARRLAAAGIPAIATAGPEEALCLALAQSHPTQPILVCGSFLTVAAFGLLIPHDPASNELP